MARQTITISDEVWLALKETAAKRKKTVGQIIEESLLFSGIKTRQNAIDLVREAQERSGLDYDDALDLSVQETRNARRH